MISLQRIGWRVGLLAAYRSISNFQGLSNRVLRKIFPYSHCFRSSHKTSEYHHQIVCLRCACVGHMGARCSVETRRSPHKKRLHVRTKRGGPMASLVQPEAQEMVQVQRCPEESQSPQGLSLSLSLSFSLTRYH